MQDITPKDFEIIPAKDKIVLPIDPSETNMGSMYGNWLAESDALSSGKVRLEATNERILIGDATEPLTGTGVFIGNDKAATPGYDFRVGNPLGNYMHWDASATTLTVIGTIQSAIGTAQRIVISTADNSLSLYNPSNSKVLSFGASYAAGSVLMTINRQNNDQVGLLITNDSALTVTYAALEVDVDKAASSSKSIFTTNVGSGSTIDAGQSGTGKVIVVAKTGTAATAVDISNSTTGRGILITTSNTGGAIPLDISDAGTGGSINITQASSTAGIGVLVTTAGLQYGLSIAKSNTDGTNALACINLTQAANVSTNFKKMMNIGGTTFWLANATTPNAVLTGATGDICINCGSGKIAYCTGTTNWTLL